jgi:TatD DNase family protein
MLIDTHCHIHEADYPLDRDVTLKKAYEFGVTKMICVGTSEQSSSDALKFADQHNDVYASIGVHPHDTKDGYSKITELARGASNKLVAVGEIGLDYYYNHSPREIQIAALESQIQTALDYQLPIIFHVREAFSDFWPVFDNFQSGSQKIRGVLHSFTDSHENAEKAYTEGLFIGVNGISTFTKDAEEQQFFASIPLDKLLLETDAPFLTPRPYRGTINEPAFVSEVAKHHAALRGISLESVASATTANAMTLFQLG